MNPRKRRAEDQLLPLRSSKQSRNTLLRTDGDHASPSQTEGIRSRWMKIGHDLLDLAKDTFAAVFHQHVTEDELSKPLPSLPPYSHTPVHRPAPAPLPPPPPPLSYSPSPLRNSLYSSSRTAPAPYSPFAPNRSLLASSKLGSTTRLLYDTPTSQSTRFKPLPNSPANFHRKQPAQVQRLSESMSYNTSHAGPSTETFPSASVNSRIPSSSLPFCDDFIKNAIAQANARPPVATHYRKKHILAHRHKKQVEEERKRTRAEILKELYERKRKSGFASTQTDFEGLLDYRAKLEATVSPRPRTYSLHHLTTAFDGASLDRRDRRHSTSAHVPDISEEFGKYLARAKETVDSPPPPRPFVASLDQLQVRARKKDESIELRLRPKRVPLPSSLPPKDEAVVNALLKKSGVVSKFAREQVSNQDLQRLRPGQWLNDEIINFYGAMILARSEGSKENTKVNGVNGHVNGKVDRTKAGKPLNVHYFSTFFWHKLINDGYQKGRLAKWTKKVDIFSKDMIVLPVNHNNMHWTGVAINFKRRRIEAYDSMNMSAPHVFAQLRAYLDAEHRTKKNQPFDFTGWEDYTSPDTPQQENGYDCGVFTCQFLDSLARGEENFNFSQQDITFLRRKMIWEIGNAKFWSGEGS